MACVDPGLSLFPARRTAGKCLAASTKNFRHGSNPGTRRLPAQHASHGKAGPRHSWRTRYRPTLQLMKTRFLIRRVVLHGNPVKTLFRNPGQGGVGGVRFLDGQELRRIIIFASPPRFPRRSKMMASTLARKFMAATAVGPQTSGSANISNLTSAK